MVAAGMLVCALAFVLLWRPMLWAFKADATMYGYGAHVFVAGDVCAALYARSAWGRAI